MTNEEIVLNLCSYDARNPDYDIESDDPDFVLREPCYCDNCFNGRTELAKELLRRNHEIHCKSCD